MSSYKQSLKRITWAAYMRDYRAKQKELKQLAQKLSDRITEALYFQNTDQLHIESSSAYKGKAFLKWRDSRD